MTLTTPELPQGHFFRIKKSNSSLYPLTVQIRKKLWIGSTLIDSTIASNDHKDVHDTMRLLVQRNDRREANRHITTNLLGDYPPKTLENQ